MSSTGSTFACSTPWSNTRAMAGETGVLVLSFLSTQPMASFLTYVESPIFMVGVLSVAFLSVGPEFSSISVLYFP